MTRISKKFIVIVSAAILTIAVVAAGITYGLERSAEQIQAELIAEEMKWFQETLRTARGTLCVRRDRVPPRGLG